jgi:hypothetical protein
MIMKTVNNIRTMALALFAAISFQVAAQEKSTTHHNISMDSYNYNNAIGLRIGETSGLDFKHMFPNGNAFEGILSTYPYAIGVTGLVEKNMETGANGLKWYFGGGGHMNAGGPEVRYYHRYYGDTRYTYVTRSGGFAAGVDGIIGIEYKFKPVPIALSTDLKPFVEWSSGGDVFLAVDPSLGVKFTF